MGITRMGVRPAPNQVATSPAQQPATTQGQPQATAKPVATFQYGRLSAAVFGNTAKTPNGDPVTVYSVSLRRSYRNAQQGWEYSHNLRASDLLPAAYLLQRCFNYLLDDADEADLDEEPGQ